MMDKIIWATPLYEFLRQCNDSPLPRVVLDCGAGGDDPPLQLFHAHGYHTFGVEIAPDPLRDVATFCQEQDMALNVFRGDMRHLPFPDAAFSFVYSFNALPFMTKAGIARAVDEMARVLRPGGLMYINVDSVDDEDSGPFCPGPVTDLLGAERFTQFEDDEADAFLSGFTILRKEKRFVDKLLTTRRMTHVFIEYIARKE